MLENVLEGEGKEIKWRSKWSHNFMEIAMISEEVGNTWTMINRLKPNSFMSLLQLARNLV